METQIQLEYVPCSPLGDGILHPEGKEEGRTFDSLVTR